MTHFLLSLFFAAADPAVVRAAVLGSDDAIPTASIVIEGELPPLAAEPLMGVNVEEVAASQSSQAQRTARRVNFRKARGDREFLVIDVASAEDADPPPWMIDGRAVRCTAVDLANDTVFSFSAPIPSPEFHIMKPQTDTSLPTPISTPMCVS